MQNLKPKNAILLLSGGIDSTTVLAKLTKDRPDILVHCLIFNYEQTLQREIKFASANCLRYGALPILVEIPYKFTGAKCSLLNKAVPIAKGRTMKQISQGTPTSYVPFRNGIFLAYAVAYGEANGITDIYCGGNGLNSGNYYDDTAEFAYKFQKAAEIGTAPGYEPKILFPFANLEKSEIVKYGRYVGVDYEKTTWSCYTNAKKHCGECDSCKQREKALI